MLISELMIVMSNDLNRFFIGILDDLMSGGIEFDCFWRKDVVLDLSWYGLVFVMSMLELIIGFICGN